MKLEPPIVQPDRYVPNLLGGDLALDFANTLSGRETPWHWERLVSNAALADWAFHVGQISAESLDAKRTAADAKDPPPAQIFVLREAIHRVARLIADHQVPKGEDLESIKRFAIRGMEIGALTTLPDGRMDWRVPVEAEAFAGLLGRVALSALDLLRREDLSRMRWCAGPDCGFVFYDRTKNASRRWCDMAVCGNRAKAKRHRGRMVCE